MLRVMDAPRAEIAARGEVSRAAAQAAAQAQVRADMQPEED